MAFTQSTNFVECTLNVKYSQINVVPGFRRAALMIIWTVYDPVMLNDIMMSGVELTSSAFASVTPPDSLCTRCGHYVVCLHHVGFMVLLRTGDLKLYSWAGTLGKIDLQLHFLPVSNSRLQHAAHRNSRHGLVLFQNSVQ